MKIKSVEGWREGSLVAACAGVPVLVLLAAVPDSRNWATASLVAGMVAGGLMMLATLVFYLHGLAARRTRDGWVAAAMLVLGSQVLLSSGLGLARPRLATSDMHTASVVDLLIVAVAIGLTSLGAREVTVPDPLVLGLGLGVALTALKVAELVGPTQAQPSAVTAGFMLAALVAGHVLTAAMMWRYGGIPAPTGLSLTVTVIVIGFAQLSWSRIGESWAVELVTAVALIGAASWWTGATLVMLRQALRDEHRRSTGLEGSLLEIESNWRGGREQLHEIRSTLAGAASASRLLRDHAIDAATHERLEGVILAELDRLERLVTAQPPPDPGPVDVDATLSLLLTSYEARGREIFWEPTGASVHARPDDVTEALNILLDNAATHGGLASRVAVTRDDDVIEIAVSDDGPGIPPEWREQIFDWGVHGSNSHGQGIGLSLARRLISRYGGSLTLDQPTTPGSSFVIRLPAARQSEENNVHDLGTSA